MTSGRSLDELTADDFLAVKGERFGLTTAGFNLELAEVTHGAGGSPRGSRAPFSVLFHGPLQPVLPQAIYRLENERLGAIELFIVPIGPEQGSMRYEAVFG
jgi:hypothetical protein